MTREDLLAVAKPILFNTEMVCKVLDGTKTATRRVVKPLPICYGPNITFTPHDDNFFLSSEKNWLRCRVCGNDPEYSHAGSDIAHHWIPPYRPDDILYVRETWAAWSRAEGIVPRIHYKADGETLQGVKWRPSIHMPKEAARIFLLVTGLRAERLQDIDDDEALKEGCGIWGDVDWVAFPAEDFKRVWDSTIKQADRILYGWDANPWVWVIDFERVEAEQ